MMMMSGYAYWLLLRDGEIGEADGFFKTLARLIIQATQSYPREKLCEGNWHALGCASMPPQRGSLNWALCTPSTDLSRTAASGGLGLPRHNARVLRHHKR